MDVPSRIPSCRPDRWAASSESDVNLTERRIFAPTAFSSSQRSFSLSLPVGKAGNKPISAKTWSGSGTYQALGGTWNKTSHVFTVSTVKSGVSGKAVTINLLNQQRVLIDDSTTGWDVGPASSHRRSPSP